MRRCGCRRDRRIRPRQPARTVARELGKPAEADLLEREKRGNEQAHSADGGRSVCTGLASIRCKTSGFVYVLGGPKHLPIATAYDLEELAWRQP